MSSPAERLAVVIAHYDPAGRLAEYLLRFLAHLQARAQRVVLVSTGLAVAPAARAGQYAQVMVRSNFGYDFWSYKLGIDALGDLSRFDRLWVLNSSFVIFDPALLCERFLDWKGEADLLGLTHSSEVRPHVQSYCFAFNRHLLGSIAFGQWWSGMIPISDRLQVIPKYELGMTAHFAQAGFSTAAVFEPTPAERVLAVLRGIETRNLQLPPAAGAGPVRLSLRDAEHLNPTHYVWEGLLERCGVLKMDLVRENAHGLDLQDLSHRLQSHPGHEALFLDALGSAGTAS